MALDYKIIGSKIQSHRRMKGITQETMAEALDFSVGFISQVERGISKLSLDSLYDITQYLECNIADIIDENHQANSSYSQIELNTIYEALSVEDQHIFLDMLKIYAKGKNIL